MMGIGQMSKMIFYATISIQLKQKIYIANVTFGSDDLLLVNHIKKIFLPFFSNLK
jgi:hypothetical protein